ncbi:MAG: 2-hydroxyacid dehydrogenase [Candidatus Ranarchaeia archaeon]
MKILIHEPKERANEIRGLLQQHGINNVEDHWGKETLADHMNGVSVLMTEFASAEVIQAGQPTLKFIQGIYRGVDGIDLEAAKKTGVMVAHTSANIISTAEHTMALILALAKKVVPADKTLRQGKWSYGYYGSRYSVLLHGKVLAIIGLGSIGQAVAYRANAFGMSVIGVRRTALSVPNCEVYSPEHLHKVLRQADIIAVTAALTPQTRGMIGHNEFDVMKPTALFVNTSRGAIVDPVALYRALKDRKITGAAIDVWYNYPKFVNDIETEIVYPAAQPFHELDNIIMTPHRGGFVPEANKAFLQEAADNVARFLQDKEPKGLVDLDAGY